MYLGSVIVVAVCGHNRFYAVIFILVFCHSFFVADAITVFMETLKTYAIVPTLVVIFLSFLIRNREWDTYEIPLKTDALLFQTCYHVVAQILAEVGN
jgi:hypothetical protein